jgi:hypothetical protein
MIFSRRIMTEQEIHNVDSSIARIISKFSRVPNIFLTEDDLRVQLCSNLLQYFGMEEVTRDGDSSISLHSEVRWYGNGDLKLRSDIVLVDVSNLDVLRYAKMPSKGYGFNTPKAIIEIKFRRPNGESQPSFLKKIQDDLNKLNRLKKLFYDARKHEQTQFWMLILDKKSGLTEPILERDGIKVVYKFANQNT